MPTPAQASIAAHSKPAGPASTLSAIFAPAQPNGSQRPSAKARKWSRPCTLTSQRHPRPLQRMPPDPRPSDRDLVTAKAGRASDASYPRRAHAI